MEGTKYGIIHGEIVILPASQASTENMGIEIKVKGATVRRELFNIAAWGKAATRIRGEIHADFLPLTSDRSGFMEDTPEFETFLKGMQKVIGDVEKVYKQLASRRENQKVSRALKEALQRVYQALSLNPDLSPFGAVPLAEKDRRRVGDETAVESGTMDQAPEQIKPRDETPSNSDQGEELSSAPEDKPKKVRKPSLRVATPNAVVKRLKFGETGVTCCLDHLGEDGPECITEGTIIYINRDHPLYKRESRKKEAHILNIARLITQEISLMKDSANPRDAFNRQSKLLRDAFRDSDD
jgi:hypothetical protein